MSALSTVLDELLGIVGEGHLLTDTAAVGEHTVDGQTPLAAAFPGTAEQVAALLRAAAEARLSVLLRGAGQHLYLGAPPGPIGLVVCLTRLDQVVEYDAGDLTITAQAGMPLVALQQIVGKHGQMLPLDPPGPESATLGGMVAANLSGPMRMRHGGPRDLVLGTRLALTTGEVIKTGGRTVKNVAGYDLTKLLIGSLGTVGAMVELTLRLAPVPEQRAVMLAALPPERALEVASRVAASAWEVSACEVVNQAGAMRLRPYLPAVEKRDAYAVCAGLSGSPEAVARQESEIRSLVGGGSVRLDGVDADKIWQRLRGLAYPTHAEAVLLRVGVLPSAAGDTLRLLSAQPGWTAMARVSDGLVYAAPGEVADAMAIKKTIAAVRRASEEAGGFAVLESAPVSLKREVGVWGEGMANADLMRKLKSAYDPAGVLGCGRLV